MERTVRKMLNDEDLLYSLCYMKCDMEGEEKANFVAEHAAKALAIAIMNDEEFKKALRKKFEIKPTEPREVLRIIYYYLTGVQTVNGCVAKI